ncbi:MAG: methyltransferase [Hyphomicrobiales bacterium]|nr:methyltransferase [Hyphomicrobiales bacterium]
MTLVENTRIDAGVEREDFARSVLDGLGRAQKELPCRFFYDARGSELFEAITDLPEYYPTRTEAAILRAHAAQIAARTRPDTCLVEFGSGSSTKTEILLDALPQLAAYVAIDVSESALEEARARLESRYRTLRVETVTGDFWAQAALPGDLEGHERLGFFPGSTIGNLDARSAERLLAHFGEVLGPGARLVIGVDVEKDPGVLIPAYNDAQGVTAAFNLNLLTRINRELGADFDLGAFRHEAIWNAALGRIEMHLVSERAQSVRVLGRRFDFARGETIHTENSHKYRPAAFHDMAVRAGWSVAEWWTDPAGLFSVHELQRA